MDPELSPARTALGIGTLPLGGLYQLHVHDTHLTGNVLTSGNMDAVFGILWLHCTSVAAEPCPQSCPGAGARPRQLVRQLDTPCSRMTTARRIAHLDMDAFFASVELLRYPQLKGLPVVIGGRRRREDDVLSQPPLDRIPVDAFPRLSGYVGRGVATTATYAARQFGVGSAMGLMKAASVCPDAILLPVDFDEVRRISRLFKSTIREIAPVIQDHGIDEVYIDLTHVPGSELEGGRQLVRTIQQRIFEATGLTCSIGVAPNKLLAKLAERVREAQWHQHRHTR